jgi:hypothetical protein
MNQQMKFSGGFPIICLLFSFSLLSMHISCKENRPNGNVHSFTFQKAEIIKSIDTSVKEIFLDTAAYNMKVRALANGDKSGKWPTTSAIPLVGALLPFNRVVAYYGNFYSTRMGVLGEYPVPEMLDKLKYQVQAWEMADTQTRVIPALHYIVVTAQGSPGDGNYRLRMPEKEIRKAIRLADSIKGIVFLDIQVGLSIIQKELPLLKKYLMLSNVHLGVDPEFSMKTGKRPGTVIGTMDAADINYITAYLASIVKENHLPPKILVVHRFTLGMLTNYDKITTLPEVQIVINMDGFGSPILKKNSYYYFVYKLPVQFTGFKLFYKNDVKTGGRMMTPFDVLQLQPRPIYIQYQ